MCRGSVVLADRESAARAIVDVEVARPFDLTSGRLMRLVLVRLADEDHVLLVTMHHIVSDGWSREVMRREVRELYAAACGGRVAALPDLPVPYGDFAMWHGMVTGSVLDRQLGYWRERLSGVEPLALPTDRPRPVERRVLVRKCASRFRPGWLVVCGSW